MADSYVGEIRIFGGNYAPEYWAFCDGHTVSISQYEALFSLLGTTFGGDGQVNFALPNLNGRVPLGDGQGAGLQPRVVGQSGGADQVALTVAQVPPHNHTFNASTASGTTTTAGGNYLATVDATTYHMYLDINQSSSTWADLKATAIGPTGGSLAHDNTQPSVVLRYIISLIGIFPPLA
jgi:microcystin-dependent protein